MQLILPELTVRREIRRWNNWMRREREMNRLCESFAPHDVHGRLRQRTIVQICVRTTENAHNWFWMEMHAKSHATGTDTIPVLLLNAVKGKNDGMAKVSMEKRGEKLEHVESNPYYFLSGWTCAIPCWHCVLLAWHVSEHSHFVCTFFNISQRWPFISSW